MSRRGVMGVVLTVGGLLVTVASLPHALLGWPALRDSLQGKVDSDAMLTAAIGWLFGGFAMATLGIVALVCASQMCRGNAAAMWPAIVVGAGYLAFGFWALCADDPTQRLTGLASAIAHRPAKQLTSFAIGVKGVSDGPRSIHFGHRQRA